MTYKTRLQIVLIILIPIYQNIVGQEISSIGEIYNFEIGDIFHYEESESFGAFQEGYWRKINDTVTDKNYSSNSDTIFYVIKRDYIEIESENQVWTYGTYSFTRTITNLDSQIYSGNIDTVYSHPNICNGRIINHHEHTNYHGPYVVPDSTLYRMRWIVGCGLVLDTYEDFPFWCEGTFILEYYKKGDEEWGTPIIIVNNQEISFDRFSFYPNPAKNEFFIDLTIFPKTVKSLIIYSISGELVKVISLPQSGINRINIHELRKGVYLMKLVLDDKIFQMKLIKN